LAFVAPDFLPVARVAAAFFGAADFCAAVAMTTPVRTEAADGRAAGAARGAQDNRRPGERLQRSNSFLDVPARTRLQAVAWLPDP
jgi:hypothetical protein